MQSVDLAPMRDCDNNYEHVIARVEERFKCNWEDEVHDSYRYYIRQVNENKFKMHEIRLETESIQKSVEDLKVGELIRQTEEMCREASAI